MIKIKTIIIKEFKHIRRDKRMGPLILISPVFQLILLGYAATMDVKDVPTIICDMDLSQESRDLINRLENTGIFKIITAFSEKEIDQFIASGQAEIGMIIPPHFATNSVREKVSILLIIDGTKAMSATVGLNHAREVISKFMIDKIRSNISVFQASDFLSEKKVDIPDINLEYRVFYNEEMKSKDFMVPAVLSMILMLMTVVLSSMNLVREKESGTIEQLIVTPLKPSHILIGKLTPFVIIGLVDVLIVVSVALLWFQVPFRGSPLFLLGASLLFLMSTLGLGLLVSTVSKTQQQAMMTAVFFVMVPSVLLSGFIFPVENMPKIFQMVSMLIPMRHYLEIVRAIFLKGSEPYHLLRQIIYLTILGVIIISTAIRLFRKRID